jgi:hypothetical protein
LKRLDLSIHKQSVDFLSEDGHLFVVLRISIIVLARQ